MKTLSIFYITDNGFKLAERAASLFPGAAIAKFSKAAVAERWGAGGALVFIMASGIVVRTIAPLLKDKKTDPAVVVLDEAGRHAISLAGGHLGGANELARKLAEQLGGEAVITTASDVNELPSIDLWARDKGLVIENWGDLPQVAARYVNNGALRVYSDVLLDLPDMFLRVVDPRFADVIITNRLDVYAGAPRCSIIGEGCSTGACKVKGQVYLRPLNLVVGIGCNSGTTREEIESALERTLATANLSRASLHSLATIDLKAHEPGLRDFAEANAFPVRIFTAAQLNCVENIERSDAVFAATGAYAVAEPAARLAAGATSLLVGKRKDGNVTTAVAELAAAKNSTDVESGGRASAAAGRIFIVGTGPGSVEHLTGAARTALAQADVIVGYGTYLDLIPDLLQGKEIFSTGMTQEVDRCRKAVELAQGGKTVAVVSGGDPGVYAMAGLVFEILKRQESAVRSQKPEDQGNFAHRGENAPSPLLSVVVVPGISALNAAAARLGAPLMHDFCCISLSDRLTPWAMIEKRLAAAAAADFVIVLYNPRSKGRAGHLSRAREIILKHQRPETVVGIVTGAMRENERVIITDLARMQDDDVGMQTTVVIGNSKTFLWNNLMITPRGYEQKLQE